MPTTNMRMGVSLRRGCVVLVGLLMCSSNAASQALSSRTLAPRTQATPCFACATRVAAQRHIPHATSPIVRAPTADLVISDACVLASSLLPPGTDDSPRQVTGALFGALWGGGVGLLLGAVIGGQLEKCSGEGPCGLGVLAGAAIGGIAGALLGAVLGHHLTDDDVESATPPPAA